MRAQKMGCVVACVCGFACHHDPERLLVLQYSWGMMEIGTRLSDAGETRVQSAE